MHNLHGGEVSGALPTSTRRPTSSQELLFRRGQAEGSLGDFDPRVMAVTYQGSIDVMIAYLEDHPEVDPGAYAAELAEILLSGMQARSN